MKILYVLLIKYIKLVFNFKYVQVNFLPPAPDTFSSGLFFHGRSVTGQPDQCGNIPILFRGSAFSG